MATTDENILVLARAVDLLAQKLEAIVVEAPDPELATLRVEMTRMQGTHEEPVDLTDPILPPEPG